MPNHQNMALKVKGLKSAGATTTDSPDVLIRQQSDNEILQAIADCSADEIKFSEWKRKDVERKGKLTKRMLIESNQIPKVDFISLFRQDLISFRGHTERVSCQYQQIKLLKEKLPKTHAICQMDFAENYSCVHADEIQTAYFDKCSVTLHPVVVYIKDLNTQELIHTSYIYVSNTQSHNSSTVYAFITRITSELRSKRPDIDCIHYITDSPTSQYRNKLMMYVVANHDKLFGLKASWQYWEAGHGKGPCDGVGGTSKRLADLAVKRQTAVIQSAEDYFRWRNSLENSQTKYCYVAKEECDKALAELNSLKIKPIKGTFSIHSVVQVENGTIAVRDTSCFCNNCFENGDFKLGCTGWTKHIVNDQADLQNREALNIANQQESVNTQLDETTSKVSTMDDVPTQENTETTFDQLVVNSYVAAVYNDNWYVGKVIDIDHDDDSLPYQISFMEQGKCKGRVTFKWPSKDDVIWIDKEAILCTINEPVPHGVRKMFKLEDSDVSLINEKFSKRK